MSNISAKLNIYLLCGGPSLERGISLNSARSVLDHLQSDRVNIQPIYFNQKREAFKLSPAQLYSNTPADFDFKLPHTGEALNEKQLEAELKKADIVFPAMHGSFGEDGTIQHWLEQRQIPFIGSPSLACKQAFDKFIANEFIHSQGFFTLPSCLLRIYRTEKNKQDLEQFFAAHQVSRAIVKPASGGSSIGVFSVDSAEEAQEKAELIFSKRMDTRVVVEPFARGREFTVIILESRFGLPVAILPTEIETDYTTHQLFDFRRKYLPTRQVTYHCPPRFDDQIIERIQLQAEQLFVLLGMKDFARFDGWVLDDGSIWFSDFNPVSGMEQNSFLFQQAARVGMSHQDVLEYIVARSCDRQHIRHPFSPSTKAVASTTERKPLAVLMGGSTSERHVSLMSGTNVWLKLRHSSIFQPIPYLLDIDGSVWRVPYQLLLNHTVEEIIHNCRSAALHEQRIQRFEQRSRERLGYTSRNQDEFGMPERFALEDMLAQHDHIFIALHGGMGENGTLQKMLEERNIRFNGSGSLASRLCINKQQTAEAVAKLHVPHIRAIPGVSYSLEELRRRIRLDTGSLWESLLKSVQARSLIAKPVADGCSSGVVHLYDAKELALYTSFLQDQAPHIPPNTFRNQPNPIELPLERPEMVRFEAFQTTDSIKVKAGALKYGSNLRTIEITIGVVEEKGTLHALQPSITLAEGEVLSVEEKFQGGTGVNLTPPPDEIMPACIRRRVQQHIEQLAVSLGIRGYARIDAFVNVQNGEVTLIEVNTLPGLTPSTVLFQQALAEKPPVYPLEFLERLADNKYADIPVNATTAAD